MIEKRVQITIELANRKRMVGKCWMENIMDTICRISIFVFANCSRRSEYAGVRVMISFNSFFAYIHASSQLQYIMQIPITFLIIFISLIIITKCFKWVVLLFVCCSRMQFVMSLPFYILHTLFLSLVHPFSAIWCTTHARYFMWIIFNVEFIVVWQL